MRLRPRDEEEKLPLAVELLGEKWSHRLLQLGLAAEKRFLPLGCRFPVGALDGDESYL